MRINGSVRYCRGQQCYSGCYRTQVAAPNLAQAYWSIHVHQPFMHNGQLTKKKNKKIITFPYKAQQ